MRYIEAKEKVVYPCQYVGTADAENGEYTMHVSDNYSPIITLPNKDRVNFSWEDILSYADAIAEYCQTKENSTESIDPEMEPYQQRNFIKLMVAYGHPELTKVQRKSFEYLAKDEDSVIDALCETARLIRGAQ